jgi:hypothetical protein
MDTQAHSSSSLNYEGNFVRPDVSWSPEWYVQLSIEHGVVNSTQGISKWPECSARVKELASKAGFEVKCVSSRSSRTWKCKFARDCPFEIRANQRMDNLVRVLCMHIHYIRIIIIISYLSCLDLYYQSQFSALAFISIKQQ